MKVRDVIKLIEKGGWYLARTRGSQHPDKPGVVTVPGSPGHEFAPGTLNSILKQSGLKQ